VSANSPAITTKSFESVSADDLAGVLSNRTKCNDIRVTAQNYSGDRRPLPCRLSHEQECANADTLGGTKHSQNGILEQSRSQALALPSMINRQSGEEYDRDGVPRYAFK